jgi:Domain of unknown function (DUF4272)
MDSVAIQRKLKSEELLRKEGVPYIAHLPIIEDEQTATIRSKEEVAIRAMALNIVAVKGEGLEQQRVLEIVEEYQLKNVFSPNELEFIHNPSPSHQDMVNNKWRYESYCTLLWALNYVEDLGRPDQICDVPSAVRFMVERTSDEFINQAVLRNSSEIFDAADLIYRYDWACVEARLKGQEAPANLNPGVVYERHYALNWLISNSENLGWDDISTDT